MKSLEDRYLNNTESGTDCSVDSDVSENLTEVRRCDMEVELDENIDDFELQEAVEDMAMDSTFKQSEMEIEYLDLG